MRAISLAVIAIALIGCDDDYAADHCFYDSPLCAFIVEEAGVCRRE
jgi:hypothetical protein